MIPPFLTGPCVVCGTPIEQPEDGDNCDAKGCGAVMCWEHASVESAPHDPHGWDGVDIHCPTHAVPHRQMGRHGERS